MINAKALRPHLRMEDVDVYLPRGIAALKRVDANPRGFFRIFQRHQGARFFGLTEYLTALASLVGKDLASEITVYAVPEGYALSRHETAITLEGPAQALLVNETLLHYLTTGTRARTLAATYPARDFPWVFMGARYLSQEDLAIFTRALATEDILSTVPRWADKFIGTESHSQIAMWGGLSLDQKTEEVISSVTANAMVAATIRATVAFARANPGVPLYVLGDFAARSIGCFEVFRATYQACCKLGIALVGGRMDISKCDLSDEGIIDRSLLESYEFRLEHNSFTSPESAKAYFGMSTMVVGKVREQLDKAGMKDFKLIVSSGLKLEEIKSYVAAGASTVGIGEEAAYFLNQGQCNYTSDAVGRFEGERFVKFVSCAKEGRELHHLVDDLVLENARPGFKISGNLEPVNLQKYL